MTFHHKLHHRTGDIHAETDPRDDDEYRENPAGGIDLAHFTVAHGRYRNDGHVKRIHEIPPLDHHVTHRAEDRDQESQNEGNDQMACAVHGVLRVLSEIMLVQ